MHQIHHMLFWQDISPWFLLWSVTKDNVNHIHDNHAKMSKSLLADLKTEKHLYSSIHVWHLPPFTAKKILQFLPRSGLWARVGKACVLFFFLLAPEIAQYPFSKGLFTWDFPIVEKVFWKVVSKESYGPWVHRVTP